MGGWAVAVAGALATCVSPANVWVIAVVAEVVAVLIAVAAVVVIVVTVVVARVTLAVAVVVVVVVEVVLLCVVVVSIPRLMYKSCPFFTSQPSPGCVEVTIPVVSQSRGS